MKSSQNVQEYCCKTYYTINCSIRGEAFYGNVARCCHAFKADDMKYFPLKLLSWNSFLIKGVCCKAFKNIWWFISSFLGFEVKRVPNNWQEIPILILHLFVDKVILSKADTKVSSCKWCITNVHTVLFLSFFISIPSAAALPPWNRE